MYEYIFQTYWVQLEYDQRLNYKLSNVKNTKYVKRKDRGGDDWLWQLEQIV